MRWPFGLGILDDQPVFLSRWTLSLEHPTVTLFIHTADWQIGKAFARVQDPAKRTLLQEARFRAIGRLGQLVREQAAEFVVVAGDLFESATVPRATVSKALADIGKLSVPVFAIPGNHDHGGTGGLWSQDYFVREQAELAPNLTLLLDFEPLLLDDAVLLPCPLLRRHDSHDPTAWLQRQDLDWQAFGDRPRIVLAHGSVHGFTTETEADEDELEGGAMNRINLARLPEGEIDYIALGDWHGTKAVGERAWYSGALEQDRFARGSDYSAGNALVVQVNRGGAPTVITHRTGSANWHDVQARFNTDADLDGLIGAMKDTIGNRVDEDLVQMTLSGSLGFAARDQLDQRLDVWRNRLLRLKLRDDTTIAPTEAEVEALTERSADPLIAKVASALQAERLAADAEAADIARLALRELYRLAH
ncbi:MAG: DNA repair exonuclease [Pseudomonadota bacterium]